MDINLDIIDRVIVEACDFKSSNQQTVTLTELRYILRESKQLVLTPFQIASLMGHSKPDNEANVDYHRFAKVCKAEIQARFTLEAQRRKAQLITVGQFRPSDVKMPVYKDGAVFAAFRTMDIDKNGFLEWQEYQQCMETITDL